VTRCAAGRFLFFGTSLVTLSLLVATPECRVPALGGSEHGFPPLSSAGRLFIKDAIIIGAAMVVMADRRTSRLKP
jgi:reactive chlorine resistance protein C